MIYAIVNELGKVTKSGPAQKIWNASFPPEGPNEEFLISERAYPVSRDIEYDHKSQRLEVCEPYFDGEAVYDRRVVPANDVGGPTPDWDGFISSLIDDRSLLRPIKESSGSIIGLVWALIFAREGSPGVLRREWGKLLEINDISESMKNLEGLARQFNILDQITGEG